MVDTEDITQYKAKNLEPLSITTATIAYDSNLRIPYKDLSLSVKADGVKILAVKSTYLNLLDCIQGGKYTRAAKILKKRERDKNKRGSMFAKPSRTLSGNQLYFQSAVEFVHKYEDKYHNIRISPARGSIQIQGVKSPIFEVARTQIESTLAYINEKMNLNEKYELFNRRVIIINTKSGISLDLMKPNMLIKIHKVSDLLKNLMILQKENKPLPIEIPYRIILITSPHEVGSYIRVKFVTPIKENINRNTTIKIFSGCKINFLGTPTIECPYYIYKFLDDFIELYKEYIFFEKPVIESHSRAVIDYITNLYKNKHSWVWLIKDNDLDVSHD